jgi:hypothetical protein
MDQPAVDLGALEGVYRRSWTNVGLTVLLSLVGLASSVLTGLVILEGEDRLGISPQLAGLAFFGMLLFSTYPLLLLRLLAGEPRQVAVRAAGLALTAGRSSRRLRWEEIRAATWSSGPAADVLRPNPAPAGRFALVPAGAGRRRLGAVQRRDAAASGSVEAGRECAAAHAGGDELDDHLSGKVFLQPSPERSWLQPGAERGLPTPRLVC